MIKLLTYDGLLVINESGVFQVDLVPQEDKKYIDIILYFKSYGNLQNLIVISVIRTEYFNKNDEKYKHLKRYIIMNLMPLIERNVACLVDAAIIDVLKKYEIKVLDDDDRND